MGSDRGFARAPLLADAERRVEKIDDDLGHHGADVAASEAVLVEAVRLVGRARELIGPRHEDGLFDGADVVLALHEVGGEGGEEFLVGGRVRQREVIDRMDDPGAEVVPPDAVDEAPCEVGVVLFAHPLPQVGSEVFAGYECEFRPAECLGT